MQRTSFDGIVSLMDDVNQTTQTGSITRNANGTIELKFVGPLKKADLEATLHKLLLHIVDLRDKKQSVVIFVDTSSVTDTGEDVSDIALKFLQTDFDFMAIYDRSLIHRITINRLSNNIDGGEERIQVFKNVDEATAWIARVANNDFSDEA